VFRQLSSSILQGSPNLVAEGITDADAAGGTAGSGPATGVNGGTSDNEDWEQDDGDDRSVTNQARGSASRRRSNAASRASGDADDAASVQGDGAKRGRARGNSHRRRRSSTISSVDSMADQNSSKAMVDFALTACGVGPTGSLLLAQQLFDQVRPGCLRSAVLAKNRLGDEGAIVLGDCLAAHHLDGESRASAFRTARGVHAHPSTTGASLAAGASLHNRARGSFDDSMLKAMDHSSAAGSSAARRKRSAVDDTAYTASHDSSAGARATPAVTQPSPNMTRTLRRSSISSVNIRTLVAGSALHAASSTSIIVTAPPAANLSVLEDVDMRANDISPVGVAHLARGKRQLMSN